jgi:hypothetical protein
MIVVSQIGRGQRRTFVMLGRKSKTAVIEREASSAGSRAAEVVGEAASEFAERAVAAAQNAQRVATPVLRTAAEKSAETLSHAAERAAVVLADTAERLAESGGEQAGQAADAARHRLANASEALAVAVRPKRRRRFRRLVVVGLIAGGIVAVVKSPLRSKLADRLFGAPPEFDDDTPESITLPSSGQGEIGTQDDAGGQPDAEARDEPDAAAADSGGDSNGLVSGSVSTKGEGAKS